MNQGRIIKVLRRMKLVSQQRVAKQLGITQQAYSKIEKKEYVEKDVLQKILAAMNSSPEELKRFEKFYPPKKNSNQEI